MRKSLALILSLSVSLGSLASLPAVELQADQALNNALIVESSVLRCVSAAVLPFMLLNNIVGETTPLADKFSPPAPAKKDAGDRDRKNAPADLSINTLTSEMRSSLTESAGSAPLFQASFLSAAPPGRSCHPGSSPPGFLVLILLMFLALYARSSLPAAPASLFVPCSRITRPSVFGRVFHLGRSS